MPCQVRDETYVMVKGKWAYYYRAVDKFGKTNDFMLSEHRDEGKHQRSCICFLMRFAILAALGSSNSESSSTIRAWWA